MPLPSAITERSTVPLGWVLSGALALTIVGVKVGITLQSMDDRLTVIERKLGIESLPKSTVEHAER